MSEAAFYSALQSAAAGWRSVLVDYTTAESVLMPGRPTDTAAHYVAMLELDGPPLSDSEERQVRRADRLKVECRRALVSGGTAPPNRGHHRLLASIFPCNARGVNVKFSHSTGRTVPRCFPRFAAYAVEQEMMARRRVRLT